jgi:hypothetical protein
VPQKCGSAAKCILKTGLKTTAYNRIAYYFARLLFPPNLRFVVEFAKKTGVQSPTIFRKTCPFLRSNILAGISCRQASHSRRLRFASTAVAPERAPAAG